MGMKEVVCTRTFTTKHGEVKKVYTRVGTLWTNDNGGMRLHVEPGIAIVGTDDPNITYWINEPRPRDGSRPGAGGAPSVPSAGSMDDDIPF